MIPVSVDLRNDAVVAFRSVRADSVIRRRYPLPIGAIRDVVAGADDRQFAFLRPSEGGRGCNGRSVCGVTCESGDTGPDVFEVESVEVGYDDDNRPDSSIDSESRTFFPFVGVGSHNKTAGGGLYCVVSRWERLHTCFDATDTKMDGISYKRTSVHI